jgi:L-lysine exporter family protein LysE/ArgO
VLTLLAFTWLNPHVYIDTVVLIGSLSAQYPGREWVFGAGAMTGSLVFFASLGYGARLLAPIFERPISWQILDVIIGVVMWTIALTLVFG